MLLEGIFVTHLIFVLIITLFIIAYTATHLKTDLHKYLLAMEISIGIYVLSHIICVCVDSFTIKTSMFILMEFLLYLTIGFNSIILVKYLYFPDKRNILLALFFVIPAFVAFGCLTNSSLHLLMNPIYAPYMVEGILFELNIIASLAFILQTIMYICLLVFLLINISRAKTRRKRKAISLLFLSLLIGVLANIIPLFVILPFDFISIGIFIGLLPLFIAFHFTDVFDQNSFGWKTFVDTVNVAMAFFDLNGNLIDYNPVFDELTDIKLHKGMFHDEIYLSENAEEFYNNDEEYTEYYNEETKKWFQIAKNPVFVEDKKVGMMFNISDITYTKNSQEEVNKSAERANNAAKYAFKARDKARAHEREAIAKTEDLDKANSEITVLMKEVHHRVKNNLMLILSFINLDRRFKTAPDQILESTAGRISSMALIHERTYKSDDLSTLNMAEFLRVSTDSMVYLYEGDEIELVYDLDEDLFVPMETMTSISLIINELMSNAIRFAFVEKDSDKKIFVRNGVVKDNLLFFEIEDNGLGFGEDYNIENSSSLGLMIIKSLVDQIDGTLTQLDSEGVGFRIEFPNK